MAILIPDLMWRDGRFHAGMALECDPASGRIVRVGPAERVLSTGGSAEASGAESGGSRLERDPLGPVEHLRGRALLPGFVNAHSHAFQRLMRGRTQWRPASDPAADFWSWREAMYHTARTLSPENVFHVSRFCFLEMLRAGITAVGEFHYLHRDRDGNAYADPNELAHCVIAAAQEVGVRIALLNVCYATGDIGRPLRPEQRRFATPELDDYLAATQALIDAYATDNAGGGGRTGSSPDHIGKSGSTVGLATEGAAAAADRIERGAAARRAEENTFGADRANERLSAGRRTGEGASAADQITEEAADRIRAGTPAAASAEKRSTPGPNRLVTIGIAPHSLRAVPRAWLRELHARAAERDVAFHMHVSEQTREVEACLGAYGTRPVQLLAEGGLLDERLTAVHATHLTSEEVGLMGNAGATVCACPTTERDLGDGFLPGAALLEAGVRIAFGSDSHTVIDPLEEMRLVEYHERLRQRRRVVLSVPGSRERLEVAPLLLEMATQAGAHALRLDAGELEPGRLADFVAIDLEHPALAGWTDDSLAATLTLSAPPDVVSDVWVGGVRRLDHRDHLQAAEMTAAFRAVAERIV